jgi:DNA replication and repair protein RecF
LIIENVILNGFRNLTSIKVSFDKNKNLIHGVNGAGKTTILEAIFLLAFGKSFLNRSKAEMVNTHAQEFIIRLTSVNPHGKNQVSACYNKGFFLTLDEKKTNIFDVNRYLYPVFFSSSDYHLYIEHIPYTRKMIDRFIFGVDTLYIRSILEYNRALKQKNILLKTTRNSSELRSWNKLMAELAEKMIEKKKTFIHSLNREIRNKFHRNLEVAYRPSFNLKEGISREVFFEQMQSLLPKELKAQRSLVGPQRDGFDIRLDSRPLKLYSSGEKKIHLLMIYISFIQSYRQARGENPVFLLDDYDTAIDRSNIDFLMKNCPEMQVIATSVSGNRDFDHLIELKKEN